MHITGLLWLFFELLCIGVFCYLVNLIPMLPPWAKTVISCFFGLFAIYILITAFVGGGPVLIR